MVAKPAKSRQDDTIGRIESGHDIHVHPQKANIPLQGLDKCVLTVGTISGLHCQIGSFHWHHFTSGGFQLHGRKKALWRSRPFDIRQ